MSCTPLGLQEKGGMHVRERGRGDRNFFFFQKLVTEKHEKQLKINSYYCELNFNPGSTS